MTAQRLVGIALISILAAALCSQAMCPAEVYEAGVTVESVIDARTRDDCYEMVYETHERKCRNYTRGEDALKKCLDAERSVLEHCFASLGMRRGEQK